MDRRMSECRNDLVAALFSGARGDKLMDRGKRTKGYIWQKERGRKLSRKKGLGLGGTTGGRSRYERGLGRARGVNKGQYLAGKKPITKN